MRKILIALLLIGWTTVWGQSSLGSVTSYTVNGNTVTMQCSKGQLVIAQCAKQAWKVSSIPTGQTLADERKSVTLTHDSDNVAEVTASDDDLTVTISNGYSSVSVEKTTALASFYDGSTLRLMERNGIDNTQPQKTISFLPNHDCTFYGGGYNGVNCNMEGKVMPMTNTQNYNWSQQIGEGKPTNICVPFIVSDQGYGILFEDHYIDGVICPSASDGTTYQSSSPTPISYVYVGSDNGSMDGVMRTYGDVTGKHELPPYWSLGYITSRYGYESQDETESVIANLEAEKMPVSGVVLDLYWEGKEANGMGNLDWYRPQWQYAEQMMAQFKKKGIHTIVITEPYFAEETKNYGPLRDLGLFVDDDCPNVTWISKNKVGLIDFLNPKAIDWMWTFYKGRTDEGVDGWWLDLGEPESVSPDAIHSDGSTVNQAHNEFGMSWIAGVWNKWKATYPDQRPLFLPRSGTSGMQRYATFPWTGDIQRSWDGLKAQVPAMVNGGMSALAYLSSDIGGFVTDITGSGQTGTPLIDVDLYLRWFQLGLFSPILRTHSQYNPEPYNEDYALIRDALRDMMNLRYRMLPYNYSNAWRNTTLGTPIVMPINYYGTEPDAATRATDEYLYGPNILVAPIMTEKTTSRQVWLPKGEWIDPVTQQRYAGSQTITFSSDDMRMPYYYRCGTFTPLYSQQTYTNTEDINTSLLDIYYPISSDCADAIPFTLYDDDKTSVNIGDRYETITFSATGPITAHTVNIQSSCNANYQGRPEQRTMHFVIPMPEGKTATVEGEQTRWYVDAAANTLCVDINLATNTTSSTTQFTISVVDTGISAPQTTDNHKSGIYDIQGRKVNDNDANRIYIRNRKKYITK